MIEVVLESIRNFMDITIFFTMLVIGVFMILVDYKYFVKVKYKRDAAVTMGIGIFYIVASFALLIISRL